MEQEKQIKSPVQEKLEIRFGKEKLDGWKKQFSPRKLSIIEVEDKICVLRPVTAVEVSEFSMMVANPGIGLEKASRYLLGELWIDGDMELQNDEEYFISAMLQVQKTAELKKSTFSML